MRLLLPLASLFLSRALLLTFSRALMMPPTNSMGNILPDLAALNRSMGHSSLLWALGITGKNEDDRLGVDAAGHISGGDGKSEDDDDDANALIPLAELRGALDRAKGLVESSNLATDGWQLIFRSDLMSLLKRRAVVEGSRQPGPVEYLMVGRVSDVSARIFLLTQADGQRLVRGDRPAADTLYYRTKWPWPLRDRDYTLARRCRVFSRDGAIVLVSRSTDLPSYPPIPGVIRVDRYWCHSTIIADDAGSSGGSSVAAVDRPGCRFVTVFSDDQKVPLPATIVDLISAQGEKVVPGAIERLHEVAREVQLQQKR